MNGAVEKLESLPPGREGSSGATRSPADKRVLLISYHFPPDAAAGTVIKHRWEGTKQFNFQTIYAVYAVPPKVLAKKQHA